MINESVDALKNINNTACNNSLAISSLSYVRNFLLTLAKIDHRLNQLYNGLRKIKSYISTIDKYIDSLSNKVITTTL